MKRSLALAVVAVAMALFFPADAFARDRVRVVAGGGIHVGISYDSHRGSGYRTRECAPRRVVHYPRVQCERPRRDYCGRGGGHRTTWSGGAWTTERRARFDERSSRRGCW
jgi:hypothetical protein